jgi:phage/plasmid-associated DNA primase
VVKINYKTGDIDLLPSSHEYLFTFKLPVRYDKDADSEQITEIFRTWTSEEEAALLFQVPAMAILQVHGMTFKKAILIIGPRNTGKTSYAVNLLTAFFGRDLISRVSLQSLIEDRFSVADLEGKILNVFDDLTAASIREVGVFKALTGSQYHDILKKGEQRYKGRLYAVHLYTANLIPYLKDYLLNDDAFFERWEIILFPTSFPHDINFQELIVSPKILSAFLNGVLKTMIDIRKNNIVRLSTATDVKDIWLEGSDPFKLQDFIRVNFDRDERIPDLQDELSKDEVTRAYEQYAKGTNLKILTKDILCQKLLHRGFFSKRPRTGDQRQHALVGYRWKPDATHRPLRKEGNITEIVG